MSDCSNHKKEVAGITDMKQLAKMIGDLHYETLAEFLYQLGDKLMEDAIRDADSKRTKLANMLASASNYVCNASGHIKLAWKISKPFMTDQPPSPCEPMANDTKTE